MERKTETKNHIHSHGWCIASIVYNIIVILIEVVILGVLNHMKLHELLSYERAVQLFHLGGMILLGVLNYFWIHKYHHIKIGGFISITGIILGLHILLLHILPRVLGIETHHHYDHGNINENQEYIILLIVITFVTIAFVFRDKVLKSLKVKDKWTINIL